MSLTTEQARPLQAEEDIDDLSPPTAVATLPVERNPRRRVRWLGVTMLCGLLVVAAGHPYILAGAYHGLVVHDAVDHASYAAILNGDSGSFELAAALWRERKVDTILVVERSPTRLIELGVLPPLATAARRELIARGLPESALQVVTTVAMTNWEAVRALDAHLRRIAPGADTVLVCPEIQTRYYRFVVRGTLHPERADRYRLCGFPSTGVDSRTWWRNRLAVAKVGMAHLRLAYAIFHGEGVAPSPNWNPDVCEKSLRDVARRSSL